MGPRVWEDLSRGCLLSTALLRLLKKSTKHNYQRLHCRERFECPSYSPGQGIRGKIGLQFLALNGCLVLLDCHGGEKNQRKSSSFSLSHVIHIVWTASSAGRCLLLSACSGSAEGEETIALSSEGFTVMQITHPITDALSMPSHHTFVD